MHDLLLVGLSVALVSLAVLYGFRTRGLRGTNDYLTDENLDLVDKVIAAERAQSAAETELGFLRQTVHGMVNRPNLVVMTDEQFTNLTNSLSQIVQSIVKPNSIN